jgi:hypothetical protein
LTSESDSDWQIHGLPYFIKKLGDRGDVI